MVVSERTIFFSNVAPEATHTQLSKVFSKCGNVTGLQLFTKNNGQSRGCGLVEYDSKAVRKKALEELSGVEVAGRPLSVKPDGGQQNTNSNNDNQPKAKSYQNQPQKQAGSNELKLSNTVLFFNAPKNFKEGQIRDFFSAAGNITNITLYGKGSFNGRGSITYKSLEGARCAVDNLSNVNVGNSLITCKFDTVGYPDRRIFFKGMPNKYNIDQISNLFGKHATIVSIELHNNKGKFSGSGTIDFTTQGGARHACEALNDKVADGQTLKVKCDFKKKGNSNNQNNNQQGKKKKTVLQGKKQKQQNQKKKKGPNKKQKLKPNKQNKDKSGDVVMKPFNPYANNGNKSKKKKNRNKNNN